MKRMVPALVLLIPAAALAQTTQPAAPTVPACNGPEHRQFDFWVGRWDVYPTGKDKLVAHSLIESLYGGCVIRENWMPLSGNAGGSVNNFVVEEGRWHQTLVSGANSRVDFQGGLVDGKMVLTGFWKNANGPGKHGLVRMSYSRSDEGAVRQFGEISPDHGLTWTTYFDFTYKPSASPAK